MRFVINQGFRQIELASWWASYWYGASYRYGASYWYGAPGVLLVRRAVVIASYWCGASS